MLLERPFSATPRGGSASAVASVGRVLAGKVQPGAWTPSRAFGADFVTGLAGVVAGEVRVS